MQTASMGIFAMCLLTGSVAWAQSSKPVLYTYVSTWTVPRAMWADYNKMESADDASLGKAVADGTLVGFGSYTVLNHTEGEPTHGNWFSAGSMANLIKGLEQLRATPGATGPVLSASKHWDYIMESHDYHATSGSFKNGYLRVGFWNYRPGASDPGGKIVKATMVPVLEKLVNDGALYSYQIDEEAIHSSDPGALNMVIIANGAEGLDKFNAAVEDMATNNALAGAGIGSLLDPHAHHDMLAHVDTMTYK